MVCFCCANVREACQKNCIEATSKYTRKSSHIVLLDVLGYDLSRLSTGQQSYEKIRCVGQSIKRHDAQSSQIQLRE